MPVAKRSKKTVTKKAAPKLDVSSSVKKVLSTKRKQVITGAVIVLVLVLLYFGRGLLVAATVNGRPITRLAMVSELEKQDGKQVLQSLVTKELIKQEASKNKITVSKDEINTEISKVEETIKKQGQTLDQALTVQGWTRADLEDQIRTQLLVEKLLADKVSVTDKEVDDYIKENKSTETKDAVKSLLKQQKLMTAYQTWIQDLLSKAKINYFVKY